MGNRINSLLVLVVVILTSLTSCKEKHFINDVEYRNQVHKDYLERRELAKGRENQLFSVMDNGDITLEEREALEFLYAYMPFSDLADRDGDFYLEQVRSAFEARDFFSWGNTIPEDVFRHFVLVYRVNNENLDTARMVFFDELKDRIKDMSMYDAALEVNHWCHEKVAYRPSDSRTSSPLATIKTSYGRCGEESTFTVTAMRAVGIPARQCYTPRWAHTDSNHAWVEVWIDGKWYYLGACEPDARLDMGWFSFPSTRAMMVHSNAFGKYKGTEEVNHQTNLFSRVNMLGNYTEAKKVTVNVIDEVGKPVPDAVVDFKLYNYAEYYPIVTRTTDSQGVAFASVGKGDLLIWAAKDDAYNYAKIDVRESDNVTIQLARNSGDEYVELFEMMPPKGVVNNINLTQEEINVNNCRLQYEDSIRNAYMATFPKELGKFSNENLTEEQAWHYIHNSEGNYAEIQKFINDNSKKTDGLFLNEYLASMSMKDLRDAKADVLQAQLTYYKSKDKYPKDVFVKGILPARISNEFLYCWRDYLKKNFAPHFDKNVTYSDVLDWTKNNVTIDVEGNYFNCPISPMGVYELRYSDKHSRDIFFVAACRALDIPAYLDNATNQLFVYENGDWNIVTFEEGKPAAETGILVLTQPKDLEIKPVYRTHYTIAKFDGGDFVTFDFKNDERVENYPVKLELEAGYYMLSTGNRYSDGTTMSRLEFFNIAPGKTVSKQVILRPLVPRDEFYGNIDLTAKPQKSDERSVADFIKKDKLVVCFIDPNREPTRHLFKDITAYKKEFEKWNGNILMVIPSDKRTDAFDRKKWNLPENCIFMYDENSEWMNRILSSTNQSFVDNYPLVYIVDEKGGLIFKSEGYRIGTGELIYKSL